MKKTIFVVGAGKGLGNHVAQKFGENGFRVVLMSRSQDHLDEYMKEFVDKGIETHVQTVDASDPNSITKAFAITEDRFGVPDVLFYNVGIITPDFMEPDGITYDDLIHHYIADVAGAYLAIQQVLGEEFSEKKGAILVTGGGVATNPSCHFLPLSMDKAALRAMCLALHEKLEKDNIYVGILTVTGIIAPGNPCDPEVLAEDFWKMYNERGDCEFVQ